MSLVTVTELVELTKFSPNLILGLLGNGELPFTKNEFGQLLIDLTSISADELARLAMKEVDDKSNGEQLSALDSELIAAELLSAFDSILTDALKLTLDWRQKELQSEKISE